jgi:hypothetical protein
MNEYKIGKPYRLYDQTVVFIDSIKPASASSPEDRVTVRFIDGRKHEMPVEFANFIMKPAVWYSLENAFEAWK